jgi:NAD-dependent SIR2 family protein deacetylase
METILKLDGEGGSLALLGEKNDDDKWTYFIECQESAMPDILDEEDQDLLPLPHKKEIVGTDLRLALEKLGRHWRHLRPIEVHPDFGWSVYKQVLESPPIHLLHWKRVCLGNNPLYRLAEWISLSNFTVVLSGAGMSTESGLPDFRSKDGWWRRLDPHQVSNLDTLEDNYELFRDFYMYRIETVERHAPHLGHRILAKWEKKGRIHGIATQNVDGYHAAAGSEKVAELHGNIRSIRCHRCGRGAAVSDFLSKRNCSACQGRLRPNVVLFGEMLPEKAWNQAMQWFRSAELVIVIGTSLQVAPASQLPQLTSGRTVYMNMEIPDRLYRFDLAIQGKAQNLLAELDEMLESCLL